MIVMTLLVGSARHVQAAGKARATQTHLVNRAYSFVLHGFDRPFHDFPMEPVSYSGVLVFDGGGNITGGSVAVNTVDFLFPKPIPVAAGSTYSVSADGTGTIKLPLGPLAGPEAYRHVVRAEVAIYQNGDRMFVNVTSRIAGGAFDFDDGVSFEESATGDMARQQ